MRAKATSNAQGCKIAKVTLWTTATADPCYKNFCSHIPTLPQVKMGQVANQEVNIDGQRKDVAVGADHSLPFDFGSKTSLTICEIYPVEASLIKEFIRYARSTSMDSDAVFLFGPNSCDRQEIINAGLDVYPLFYIVPTSRAAEARAALANLTNERKILVTSSTLPDRANAEEIKFLFQAVVSNSEGTFNAAELDLSAPRGAVSQITVTKGAGLMVADLTGKSDPYCKIGFGPKLGSYKGGVHTTKTKKQTLNPIWGPSDKATVKFDPAKVADQTLWIEVWDEDLIGSDRMGFCSIPVASLTPGEIELKVKPVKKEKATGSIWINVQ